MGLFGSRKVTQVGTSVSRVIEDGLLPNSIKSGVFNALMEKDDQMIEHVMEELSSSLGTRLGRYYRYGKNQYIHGLPSGTSMSNLAGEDTILAAIEAEVGAGVDIDYYHFGPVNLLHLGWLQLVNNHAYDAPTNTLVIPGLDKLTFLVDMQPVVTEASLAEMENGSLDVWGKAPNTGVSPMRRLILPATAALTKPSPFVVDATAPADYVSVKYCWEEDEITTVSGVEITKKVVKQGELALPLTGFEMESDYHQVRYARLGKVGYWLYRVGSGLKPEVEAVFETAPGLGGTFFPIAYFRLNKINQVTATTSPEFISTKKLLKIINMDYEEVGNAIHDNPDIADVEQAMMMMAVPAQSTEPIECRYLFEFFNNLYEGSRVAGATTRTETDWDIREKFNIPNQQSTIIIQDWRFKMALSWRNITRRRIAGSIGPVGTHTAGNNVKEETKQGVTVAGITVNWQTGVPTHIYRRQITENIYEELLVVNLKMTYHIFGEYTTTGDENDDILLIPLDHAIVEHYSIPERELLCARSLHYVFNSRVVTKLRWYQTGIFRALLIIAAIVIAVYNIYLGAKALAAAATLSAAAKLLLIFVIKYIAVTIAVKLFVKVVGAKIAFIVAIVAAIFGMYQAIEAGSIQGAPWAKELLQISSNLAKGSSAGFAKDFEALQSDGNAWQKEVDKKLETLEKAKSLLDDSNHLRPILIWGETPSDFYQRTVHSGNIGVLGIEAISSYVDIQLMLPKLSDTLGEIV